MASRVIAIDGPSASGKSSTAGAVARALGFSHLDSGALYRGVTLVAIRAATEAGESGAGTAAPGDILREAEERGLMLRPDGGGFVTCLEGVPVEDVIRDPDVTAQVSAVAALPAVRDWVNSHLRDLVSGGIDVVVDGRDIGSVVFPEAGLKIFLTASPVTRAERRIRQRGHDVEPHGLQRESDALEARDRADSAREAAPLRQAEDAVALDGTGLTFQEQVDWIVEHARERFGITRA